MSSLTSELADARQVRDASVPAAGRAGMNCDAWCVSLVLLLQALESMLRFLELFQTGCSVLDATMLSHAGLLSHAGNCLHAICIVMPVLTLVLPGVV